MRSLAQCVDTRIRPTRRMNLDRDPEHTAQCFFDHLLNRTRIALALPAGIRRAAIGER